MSRSSRHVAVGRSCAAGVEIRAIASVDSLREDIVEAALMQLFASSDLNLRHAADFRHVQSEFARALFPFCVEWLAQVEERWPLTPS